ASIRRVALNNVATTDAFFSDLVNLTVGRTLYVVGERVRSDPDAMASFIGSTQIEVLDGTPTQVEAMLTAGHASVLETLRILIVGGEAVNEELWQRLRGLRNVRVLNMYGPTECTVDVTAATVGDHPTPVIGSELPGCKVWVLDEQLRPVTEGERGELCVTG